MPTFERFEDIEAWRTGRILTRAVYQMSKDGAFASDYGLRDQMRRAAVSITSNIAEGFERSNNREFRRFLSFAKGSAGEVRSQLYVALDEGYIDQISFDRVYGLAMQTIRQISGLMRYLSG